MEQSSYLVFPSIDPVIFSVGPLNDTLVRPNVFGGLYRRHLLAQKRLSETN